MSRLMPFAVLVCLALPAHADGLQAALLDAPRPDCLAEPLTDSELTEGLVADSEMRAMMVKAYREVYLPSLCGSEMFAVGSRVAYWESLGISQEELYERVFDGPGIEPAPVPLPFSGVLLLTGAVFLSMIRKVSKR